MTTAERLLREATSCLIQWLDPTDDDCDKALTLIDEIHAYLSSLPERDKESAAVQVDRLITEWIEIDGIRYSVQQEVAWELRRLTTPPASQGLPEEPDLRNIENTATALVLMRDYQYKLLSLAKRLSTERDAAYGSLSETTRIANEEMDRHKKEVERQQERIRELEKDAARYRWLRSRFSGADMNYKDFGDGQVGRPVAIFSVTNPWPFSFDYELAATLLDSAIDAARGAQEKD